MSMKTKELVEKSNKYIAQTYGRFPVALVSGKGTKVWDVDGKEYLDFVSGIAVCNLGHCPDAVVTAVQNQVKKLLHVSNLYHIEPQVELAEELVINSFADKAFFCNSGAEANEAAIKLVRKYFHDQGKEKNEIITMKQSFHGRTVATLSATGQSKMQKGFEPLLNGFKYVPFDDTVALKEAISSETCAVMVEPIQGEGGVNIPDVNYLKSLREICDNNDLLLILDEVQTAMGRTGRLFAYQHYNIEPDIMTLAKGLAGGIAIGAMLATDKVISAFKPGNHASTFGGNPLAAAAGLAAFKEFSNKKLLSHVEEMGTYFLNKLNDLKKRFPFIKEVRGKGLMVAMEMDSPSSEVVNYCMDKGFLINCIQEKILRFIPPLIVQKNEIDSLINILEQCFEEKSGRHT
ncbi:MAG TPA: acetylornithine transaminase [Nitrospinota bacterium]|nr:acetylornithine transaminase [Nitrospinota bacterium]